MEGTAAQHGAVALLGRGGRADHHVRPSGYPDATVRRARWRRQERADDPGPRRVHPVDPTHAGRVAEGSGQEPGARQQQPQAQLDAAKVALNGDPNANPPTTGATGALDTAKAALTTTLAEPATTSTDDLRATCKALETELDDTGRPRTTTKPRRRRRVVTSSTRPTTTTAQSRRSRGRRRGSTRARA